MSSQMVFTKQDIIDRSEARYAKAQYRETHALLINWEDDDLKAKSELRGLEFVLRDSYGIVTRLISIPSRDYMPENTQYFKDAGTKRRFQREINEFIRLYSAPDILLLVIYLGCGHYDEDLVFTLRGFSKAISKETQRVMPKFRWSIAESGLLEAASDVVMLFDLRGDVDDDLPTCRPNTSEYLQQASINKLLINYSAPNTPRDAGKSFAYTKILRDHLRSTALSHTPFVTINSAHKHVGDYIFQAHDRLGVAIVPFCFDFPSMEMQPDMPLITFDSTYPSVDLLKGVGDSRWGPLGRLPSGWEKTIDNNDTYWRPYYKDSSGMKHATRPWISAVRSGEESWDAVKFASSAQQKVLNRVMAAGVHVPKTIAKGSGEWAIASDEFSSWWSTNLRNREEEEFRGKAACEEAHRLAERLQAEADRQFYLEPEEADRQEALLRDAAARQEAIRQEVMREEAIRLEAVQKQALEVTTRQRAHQEATQKEVIRLEAVRQQALEHAAQEAAQGEAFRKQQEEQHAMHRLEASNRLGGVTGMSTSRFAPPVPMNVPVRGRGTVKFFPPQVSAFYGLQEKKVPVTVETVELVKDQYSVVTREVEEVQHVQMNPRKSKNYVAARELETPQDKVEVQQVKHEVKTAGMNAWQLYLARGGR